ncbi:astacin [Cooperia oncophora]
MNSGEHFDKNVEKQSYWSFQFGVTSHEIGHLLGLFHHQQRYDRDAYVRFVPANVPQQDWVNFETISPTYLDTYGLPYDVGSVMHYAPTEYVFLNTMQVLIH